MDNDEGATGSHSTALGIWQMTMQRCFVKPQGVCFARRPCMQSPGRQLCKLVALPVVAPTTGWLLCAGAGRKLLARDAAATASASDAAAQGGARAAAPNKPYIMGPSWHSLGLPPLMLKSMGQAGQCYMKEVGGASVAGGNGLQFEMSIRQSSNLPDKGVR
jgi:hypothetical protein